MLGSIFVVVAFRGKCFLLLVIKSTRLSQDASGSDDVGYGYQKND